MMTECGVCGKRIVIPDPMFYVYKRGEAFFCSKNCMIVHNSKLTGKTGMFRTERKEEDMKHRLTRDQKQKAVEIALQGGDYLAYLKKAGAKNPSAAWWYIKATLEKADPEKYKELMKVMEENRPVVEIAEKLPSEAVAEVPEVEGLKPKLPEDGQGINLMTKQEHKAAHKGIKNERTSWPPPPGGFYISQDIKVTRFETNFGKFSKTETGRIQAEIKSGTCVTAIILEKDEWIQLMGEIEAAMKIFAGGQ